MFGWLISTHRTATMGRMVLASWPTSHHILGTLRLHLGSWESNGGLGWDFLDAWYGTWMRALATSWDVFWLGWGNGWHADSLLSWDCDIVLAWYDMAIMAIRLDRTRITIYWDRIDRVLLLLFGCHHLWHMTHGIHNTRSMTWLIWFGI